MTTAAPAVAVTAGATTQELNVIGVEDRATVSPLNDVIADERYRGVVILTGLAAPLAPTAPTLNQVRDQFHPCGVAKVGVCGLGGRLDRPHIKWTDRRA